MLCQSLTLFNASLIAYLLLETPSPQLLDDIYVMHTFPVRMDD